MGGVECFVAVERREDSAADLSDGRDKGTKEQTNKQTKSRPFERQAEH